MSSVCSIFSLLEESPMTVFNGTAGNDTLPPVGADNSGADEFFAGAGDDTITGGTGNDTVAGEAGNDRNIWNNGDNTDTFDGGDGIDVQEVNGSTTAGDTFTLSASGSTALFSRTNLVPFSVGMTNVEGIEVNGLDGDDSFTIGNLAGTSLAAGTIRFDGGNGNDTLNASASATAVTALGGAGIDNLTGSSAADTIDGGADADQMTGGLGPGRRRQRRPDRVQRRRHDRRRRRCRSDGGRARQRHLYGGQCRRCSRRN